MQANETTTGKVSGAIHAEAAVTVVHAHAPVTVMPTPASRRPSELFDEPQFAGDRGPVSVPAGLVAKEGS